jgi:drug/metabolite transporter (DMT)-like permease
MRDNSNGIVPRREAAGVLLGLTGVVAFSLSLPATRVAVAELDPLVVGLGRAVVAAVLAAGTLLLMRAPRPRRDQLRGLAVVAFGVVLGFPLLTALALRDLPSAHGAVVAGLLPAATAVAAVALAGERPSRAFWAAVVAGVAAVLAFGAVQGAGTLHAADLLLLLGVAVCGVGYAQGAVLARELGGPATICWALLIGAPFLAPAAAVGVARSDFGAVSASAWAGFAYVSVVSMFLGFFAWYAGLARGGVARVSQLQLAMPVLTLGWSALLLGERVTVAMLATAVLVLCCVAVARRTSVAQAPVRSRPSRSATSRSTAGTTSSKPSTSRACSKPSTAATTTRATATVEG